MKLLDQLYPKGKRAERKKKAWRNIAFLDPGLTGSGIALWYDLQVGAATPPVRREALSFRSGTMHTRAIKYTQAVRNFLARYLPDSLVIEFPTAWPGSAKSYTSIQRGDLFKLTYLVGMIAGVAQWKSPCLEIAFVTPARWKGQLDKLKVRKRIYRALRDDYPNHVEDAVGMGLSAAGVL